MWIFVALVCYVHLTGSLAAVMSPKSEEKLQKIAAIRAGQDTPKTNKPTVCKYLLTKKYTCEVPVNCDATDKAFNCKTIVNGTWSDDDYIVHYFQVCVFTDHFTTCVFNTNGKYECTMVWEQTDKPSGAYTGNAFTGFKKDPLPQEPWRRRHGRAIRVRREGGGTC